jgi:hypothetical protein
MFLRGLLLLLSPDIDGHDGVSTSHPVADELLVKDAINAGHPLTKTIRVFVSSTGDVRRARNVADRVMRSISGEFNLPVSASHSNFQRLAEESCRPETDPQNHGALVPWKRKSERNDRLAGEITFRNKIS